MTLSCGIDTGGTFTDCVLLSDEGVRHAKVPSTPDDFTRGVVDALTKLAEDAGTSVTELVGGIDYFFHGTTVSTNIMVRRSGATAGLLTTAGFRDIIFIQRSIGRVTGLPPEQVTRISATDKPAPIVPKSRVAEVAERIDAKGEVVVPLNEDSCRAAVGQLLEQDVEAIGIAFLWSFRNDSHERMAEEIVHELAPGVLVSRSSALAPRLGEYERTATMAINAYVAPAMERYLDALEGRLRELGLRKPMLVMTAPGGVVSTADAVAAAVSTIGSGPTGGVIGATTLCAHAGWSDVIATDMGGTSFEVGLIVDGEPVRTATSVIAQYEYFSPSIAIHSIGAGGGSIAWIDERGRPRVGPDSAGAAPGPACYGRGGTEPTVTDAELLLGYLGEDNLLANALQLDRGLAAKAMAKIAEPLGMSVEEAASGVAKICEFAMADLIRKHTVQEGHDPRDFVLLVYGGAGPVHAGVFGAELGIKEMIVPVGDLASLWSAFGVSTASILHVLEHTEMLTEPLELERLREIFAGMRDEARKQLAADGVEEQRMRFTMTADMRHRGQVHEVPVEVVENDFEGDGSSLITRFEDKYESLYGRGAGLRDATIELMTLRLNGQGAVGDAQPFAHGGEGGAKLTPVGERPVFWSAESAAVPTPIYRGAAFLPGERIEGPGVVELPDTTVVVHPGQELEVDGIGNLVLRPGVGDDASSGRGAELAATTERS